MRLAGVCGTNPILTARTESKSGQRGYRLLLQGLAKANAPPRRTATMALITFFPPTPPQSKSTDDKFGIGILAHGYSMCQFHFFARCQDKSY